VAIAPSLIAPATAQPLRAQGFAAPVVLTEAHSDGLSRPPLQERVSSFPESDVQRYVVTYPSGNGKASPAPYLPAKRTSYPQGDPVSPSPSLTMAPTKIGVGVAKKTGQTVLSRLLGRLR
jgi:hypothetical protein